MLGYHKETKVDWVPDFAKGHINPRNAWVAGAPPWEAPVDGLLRHSESPIEPRRYLAPVEPELYYEHFLGLDPPEDALMDMVNVQRKNWQYPTRLPHPAEHTISCLFPPEPVEEVVLPLKPDDTEAPPPVQEKVKVPEILPGSKKRSRSRSPSMEEERKKPRSGESHVGPQDVPGKPYDPTEEPGMAGVVVETLPFAELLEPEVIAPEREVDTLQDVIREDPTSLDRTSDEEEVREPPVVSKSKINPSSERPRPSIAPSTTLLDPHMAMLRSTPESFGNGRHLQRGGLIGEAALANQNAVSLDDYTATGFFVGQLPPQPACPDYPAAWERERRDFYITGLPSSLQASFTENDSLEAVSSRRPVVEDPILDLSLQQAAFRQTELQSDLMQGVPLEQRERLLAWQQGKTYYDSWGFWAPGGSFR